MKRITFFSCLLALAGIVGCAAPMPVGDSESHIQQGEGFEVDRYFYATRSPYRAFTAPLTGELVAGGTKLRMGPAYAQFENEEAAGELNAAASRFNELGLLKGGARVEMLAMVDMGSFEAYLGDEDRKTLREALANAEDPSSVYVETHYRRALAASEFAWQDAVYGAGEAVNFEANQSLVHHAQDADVLRERKFSGRYYFVAVPVEQGDESSFVTRYDNQPQGDGTCASGNLDCVARFFDTLNNFFSNSSALPIEADMGALIDGYDLDAYRFGFVQAHTVRMPVAGDLPLNDWNGCGEGEVLIAQAAAPDGDFPGGNVGIHDLGADGEMLDKGALDGDWVHVVLPGERMLTAQEDIYGVNGYRQGSYRNPLENRGGIFTNPNGSVRTDADLASYAGTHSFSDWAYIEYAQTDRDPETPDQVYAGWAAAFHLSSMQCVPTDELCMYNDDGSSTCPFPADGEDDAS